MKNDHFVMTNFTEEENQQISERLAFLRNNVLHLSQSQCADALNISQTYLSMLESGKRKISADTIQLYVERFDANINWILTGDESTGVIVGQAANNADYYIQKKQLDSVMAVKSAYHLDKAEADFLTRFLSMDSPKRKRFIKTLSDLKEF